MSIEYDKSLTNNSQISFRIIYQEKLNVVYEIVDRSLSGYIRREELDSHLTNKLSKVSYRLMIFDPMSINKSKPILYLITYSLIKEY